MPARRGKLFRTKALCDLSKLALRPPGGRYVYEGAMFVIYQSITPYWFIIAQSHKFEFLPNFVAPQRVTYATIYAAYYPLNFESMVLNFRGKGGESQFTLHWCHNDHEGVSNHQPHGCLLNRIFGRRSKKTSNLRVTGHCAGNSPGPVNSLHKGPVTRKMFPFDDVIMNWGPIFLSIEM